MIDFSYRLVLLTHGDAPHLDRVLEAFAANVTPVPIDRVCVIDGPGRVPPVEPLGPWRIVALPEQSGFCAATREAWHEACEPGPEHVFWLENDFVIDRPVHLPDLGMVLGNYKGLAQMALMRDAVNEQEKAAGGLFESRFADYTARLDGGTVDAAHAYEPVPPLHLWHEHRAYFTTNPSLMRREFMVDHPWPATETSECEGKFGLKLAAHGWRFGVWGDGSVYCRHVGVRSGFGY